MTLPLAGASPFLSRRRSDNVAPPAWRAVGRLLSTGHLLAWADQAVVSAASFLALIMIGRWTDAGQLGTYALGNSLLVMLIWAQDALITRPYCIQLDRTFGTPAEHAFHALLLSVVLAFGATFALGAIAVVAFACGAQPELPGFVFAVAAAVPFVLLREFARRFAFAHMKMLQALMLDVAVAILFVAVLASLGSTGQLSARSGFAALAISCGLSATAWLYLTRRQFAFRLAHLGATLEQSWGLGKWLLSNQLAVQGQAYATYWLSLIIGGAAVTGIYAACTSIVSFTNPLVFGFFNILTPRSVRTLRSEGVRGLRRQAGRDALLLGAVMAAFSLVVLVFGDDLMRLLYPGSEYQGNAHTLVVLALAATVAAASAPASVALASVDRARALATITASTAVLTIILVWVMMTEWGLLGAAYGLLISEMLGSIARWMAFLLLVPESAGSGGDRPTIGPATRAHCRKGERLQEGLCSDATPIVTTAAAVDNWSTQSSALAEEESGAGRILLRFFELLDRAGIRYCVLHGYEDYPHRVDSDIDCVIDAAISPRQFYNLLHRERSRLGAKVVRCRGYHFVLAGRNADDSLCFVTLDLSIDCELENLTFYPGSKLLDSRRRYRQFWVSPPKVEFICYLSRTILKGSLDATRIQRLSNLFEEDAAGCEEQLGRVFDSRSADLLLCAARSGDWSPVRHCLAKLQTEVRRRALLLWPLRTLRKGLHSLLARIAAIWRPQGLDVVLLGPDGAGKSSVIDALPPMLAPVFNRSACFGLVPSLMQSLVHGRDRVQTNPHALPPRSMPVSVVRAVFYWFAYYIVAYGLWRVMMARATLVLNDRHFVDVLVDAKRYRYGGPMWLLRLIWRISPKPDLIVLLDAPPEVLQARKQELSFDETARLCAAYLSMVRSMKAGHVVDADRPFEHVARDVSALILRVLAARLARRFRCEHAFPPQTMALDAI